MKRRISSWTILGTLCILLSISLSVHAQDTRDTVKNGTLDLSVPESPAFAVLGLTPETVIRPSTTRALATSLLNGFDHNGTFQTGFAFDFAPYMLFAGNALTLSAYRTSPSMRFLARTQFSIATTKGSNTDPTARAAAGFRFTLFDKGDPRTDSEFANDLVGTAEAAARLVPPLPPSQNSPSDIATHNSLVETTVENATKAVRQKWAQTRWNKSAWVIGGSPSWVSSDGSAKHLKWSNGALWTSLSYGFEGLKSLQKYSQIVFHVRIRNKDSVRDSLTGETYTQNTRLAGGKLRLGTATSIGSAEIVYFHVLTSRATKDDYLRITTGFEQRLADNLWLQLGIGGESGRKDGREKLFILSSFKWGWGGGK